MHTMKTVRPLLWARSGGKCEISGLPIEFDTFDAHHRRAKGMGGTAREDRDNPDNLLALHPLVHNLHPQSVHMRPEWSRGRGYVVPKWMDNPGGVPVLLHGLWWTLLSPAGTAHRLYRAQDVTEMDWRFLLQRETLRSHGRAFGNTRAARAEARIRGVQITRAWVNEWPQT